MQHNAVMLPIISELHAPKDLKRDIKMICRKSCIALRLDA